MRNQKELRLAPKIIRSAPTFFASRRTCDAVSLVPRHTRYVYALLYEPLSKLVKIRGCLALHQEAVPEGRFEFLPLPDKQTFLVVSDLEAGNVRAKQAWPGPMVAPSGVNPLMGALLASDFNSHFEHAIPLFAKKRICFGDLIECKFVS